MAVIDTFLYNGEADVLELRLNILYPHADVFLIGEAPITFSGQPKTLYYLQQQERFKQFSDKIMYWVVEEYYQPWILGMMQKEYDLLNTNQPFLMAFYQKESLNIPLRLFKEEDTVYYGDVDEIWTPQQVQKEPHKLEQLSYSMYLNNRTTEPWKGTAIAKRIDYTNRGIGHIRQKTDKYLPNGGWHFTNCMGYNETLRKIESYDHQEVNTKEIKDKLRERFNKREDFLGRGYTSWLEEEKWPPFLIQNRHAYKHLLWENNRTEILAKGTKD